MKPVNGVSSQNKQLDPGGVLRSAREAAGLTTQDVADSLNLLICNVEAIEDNNYSKMHGDLFVRGYVKTYARHLELDVDAVVAEVNQLLEAQHGVVTKRDRLRDARRRARGMKPAHKAVIVILLTSLLWVVANHYLGAPQKGAEPAAVDPKADVSHEE